MRERKTMGPEEKSKFEKEVAHMYSQGMSQKAIAETMHIDKSTVRRIAIQENVYIPKRSGILLSSNQNARINEIYSDMKSAKTTDNEPWHVKEKKRQAIKAEDIMRIRRSTKVGSTIVIRTEKANPTFGTRKDGHVNASVRRATVISTKSPVFCLVQIEKSGVTEAVRWADILIAKKNDRKYI